MIEKADHDCFTVSCELCGHSQTFDTGGNWQVLMADLRAAGWSKHLVKGEWEHHCPRCTATEKAQTTCR